MVNDAKEVSLGFTPGDLVIVTGAGSGIGRATAINAAGVGLRVAAWDLNPDGVAETVSDLGDAAVAVTADVTDEISWAILFLLSPLASYINGVLLTVDGGWTVTQ